MAGETRIIAFDTGGSDSAGREQSSGLAQAAPLPPAAGPQAERDEWLLEDEVPSSRPADWLVPALALLAIAAWTGFFAWARHREAAMLADPAAWPAVISQWAVPVLLIGVVWLIALRNSRHEAARFGATARLLATESALLENRLTTVNRELSLAREFLAAQTRDLEAMGRLAADRLSGSAERLQELVRDNGARIESLGCVSEAALDNMEKLRSQLPVIASSAKDVTNNIGTAGRTAHAQLAEMVSGFNRLNEFGQASERQVASLRAMIDEALGEFTRQSEQLDTIANDRFAALAERGSAFRAELDGHEVAALAAIRTRAGALVDELRQTREQLDGSEAESLTSLRARLGALRDEGATISRALRDGETRAIEGWQQAAAELEAHIAGTVGRIESEQARLAGDLRQEVARLGEELERVTAAAAERSAGFDAERGRRHDQARAAEDEALARLAERLAAFDADLAERRAAHERQSEALIAKGEAIASQLGTFTRSLSQVAEHGEAAESRIAQSLALLNENLATSRTALTGTGEEIARLTDDSVRLLEILQASRQQTGEELPHWLAAGEERLSGIEARISAMREAIEGASRIGENLSGTVEASTGSLMVLYSEIETMQSALAARHDAHREALGTLRSELDGIGQRNEALASHARGELTGALELLNTAAGEAIAAIGGQGAATIAELARQFGDESADAIEQAMRTHAAQAAGQLEIAASHAAGVSREAAVQLRDQLAKVNELVGHLERRVAHARQRAEEQVDNDFARRAALITEALNSNAIDIARALSTDVADTAWAAYLRGDRGIFTRRAVNLLETGETRQITQLYDGDREFREHVSRYVHDFEAILRQVLSTRDGPGLGVTLLSSDMGKLYVALAQAIERLRD